MALWLRSITEFWSGSKHALGYLFAYMYVYIYIIYNYHYLYLYSCLYVHLFIRIHVLTAWITVIEVYRVQIVPARAGAEVSKIGYDYRKEQTYRNCL